MLKVSIYIISFLLTVLSMEGLNLNSLFKQSKVIQARIIYMLIAISISYLVTNFIYDFFNCFKVL